MLPDLERICPRNAPPGRDKTYVEVHHPSKETETILSARLHNITFSEAKSTINPARQPRKILRPDRTITSLNRSVLSNIDISILNSMMEFQMLHELELRKAGRQLLFTGADLTLKIAVAVLDMLHQLA